LEQILSIITEWDNPEHTAIRITYERPWDWKEFEHARAAINEMLGSTDNMVDLIFDVRKGGPPPAGAVNKFRSTLQTQHLNRGMIIFVGGAIMVQTFLNLILRIYSRAVKTPNFTFANSLEEARALIERQRKA
jgi:hypothetical protein